MFDILSLTAALGPLKAANHQSGRDIFRWQLMSWDGGPVICSEGWSIAVDSSVNDDMTADITLVCAGAQPDRNMPPTLPDHIRKLWRRGQIVGSLGSGTFVLAKSGILAGHRFTLHWAHQPSFKTQWPDLEPSAEIYCIDRRIFTCAGGVASADLTLQLVHDRCGLKISHSAMHACVITSRRSETVEQKATIASRVQSRNKSLVKAVAWIEERFLDEECLKGVARAAGASTRQLQRLFQAHLGMTPIQYMTSLRIGHARALLAETNMSVQDVALICGYDLPSTFSKAFRLRFGVPPSRYSQFDNDASARKAIPAS
ncbi:MAG: helix-turn-helix domain-containing protein [Paracoccaceae bacterium]